MLKIIKVLGICLLLVSFSQPPSNQKIIVIDAGHGGKDSGAKTDFVTEKDYTLSIAKKVKNLADGSDVKIVLTRNDDTFISLQDRLEIINDVDADQIISLHLNKSDRSEENGYEFYISNENEKFKESLALATELLQNLPNDIAFSKIANADFYLLRHVNKPATLIDLGYISNKRNSHFISSTKGQEKIAQSIWTALAK